MILLQEFSMIKLALKNLKIFRSILFNRQAFEKRKKQKMGRFKNKLYQH